MQHDLDLIRSLEEELLQEAVRASPDRVAMLLADNFVEFGRSGAVYRKEEVIRSLAAERSIGDPSTLSAYDFVPTTLSDDAVLLTYRSVRKSAGDGKELHSLRSSIWKFTGGRWQMVFHQGTPTQP